MPGVMTKHAAIIQQVMWIVGSIIALVVGVVTINLDSRYVKASEAVELLEPNFAPADIEEEIRIHTASEKIHSESEVSISEFNVYKINTDDKFESMEGSLIRIDDKLDRLIEMQLTNGKQR